MNPQHNLDFWRQEIREIDDKILQLLSERMDLSHKIGDYKGQKNLPIKDFQIENKVISRSREQADKIGLDPNLAEDLMTTIIRYSVLRQDANKHKSCTLPPDLAQEVLILGGSGRMGQWFARFYDSLGFSVSIYDLNEAESPKFPRVKNLASEIDRFDFFVLATPMTATASLLEKLIELNPRGLIIDIGSLKSPILSSLTKAQQAGLKIASIHPMFGPDTELLTGKNIIFCTGPGLDSNDQLFKQFHQTSAHLIDIPIADHDHHMSFVLGAAHLMNLIYSNVLAQSGTNLQSLMALGGTTFLHQYRVTSKVVAENQNLYYEIQVLNQFTPNLICKFKKIMEQYLKAIEDKSCSEFSSLMTESREFFHEKMQPI